MARILITKNRQLITESMVRVLPLLEGDGIPTRGTTDCASPKSMVRVLFPLEMVRLLLTTGVVRLFPI